MFCTSFYKAEDMINASLTVEKYYLPLWLLLKKSTQGTGKQKTLLPFLHGQILSLFKEHTCNIIWDITNSSQKIQLAITLTNWNWFLTETKNSYIYLLPTKSLHAEAVSLMFQTVVLVEIKPTSTANLSVASLSVIWCWHSLSAINCYWQWTKATRTLLKWPSQIDNEISSFLF